MLSSQEPRTMTIEVDRCGKKSAFSFTLGRAADIMRRNEKQAVGGAVIPLWVPQKYLSCFL